MRLFRRGLRHPFYPALQLARAGRAIERCPALAGTFQELEQAARAGVQVARAVFPLQTAAQPFLAERERETLWAKFGVPVMAILLDCGDRAIGWECELQDGFHLAPGYRGNLPPGSVENATCDCGRPGPRLVRVRSKHARLVPATAIYDGAGARIR